MPSSKSTITNRLQRALLQIAESSTASTQERLDALEMILESRKLVNKRDHTPAASSRRSPTHTRVDWATNCQGLVRVHGAQPTPGIRRMGSSAGFCGLCGKPPVTLSATVEN
jgi:hypothetical protein